MTRKDFTVEHYMTREPATVAPGDSLQHALTVMQDRGFRHLPVVDGGTLKGVLSERDAKTALGIRGADVKRMTVQDVFSPDPYVTHPNAPLKMVAQEMAEKRYGSAVVMEMSSVVGIVTTTDLARALAEVLP